MLEANMKRPLLGEGVEDCRGPQTVACTVIQAGKLSPMGEANEETWGVGSAHSTLRAGEPSTWGRG